MVLSNIDKGEINGAIFLALRNAFDIESYYFIIQTRCL